MPLVFIDLLKALAAVLITNSHLADVWPISAIASGGMLGNVLFFAVSGYCLTMPNRGGGYTLPALVRKTHPAHLRVRVAD